MSYERFVRDCKAYKRIYLFYLYLSRTQTFLRNLREVMNAKKRRDIVYKISHMLTTFASMVVNGFNL